MRVKNNKRKFQNKNHNQQSERELLRKMVEFVLKGGYFKCRDATVEYCGNMESKKKSDEGTWEKYWKMQKKVES